MEYFDTSDLPTREEEVVELKKLGFVTNPLNKIVQTIDEAWEYAQSTYNTRDSLEYQIDGIVIKANDNRLARIAGVVGKTPRAWAAIKFQGTNSATFVRDIVWQVGRTGKLTPVAVLEPVILDGVTVTRATLHNYKEVVDSQIHLDDTVVVHKAGDIIPEVKEILTNVRLQNAQKPIIPDTCPSCGEKVLKTKSNVDLYCPNSANCRDQIVGRLSYFASRDLANIAGLSEKHIEKFVELFGIRDINDLYDLPYESISKLDGWGNKSVENLRESVQSAKAISEIEFVAGLGIEGVGKEVAKLLLPLLRNI